ncbi:hypothetical protein [Caballeronia sordidicola]|jgi:hypothetical protein|uniref:hypothetical protein n=1 Tax=Caballeronia sordidicola TaxID=196367 RepID=UPI000B789987|nr:hypothetical protein [Caballeronia sordidicola]
MQITKNFRLMIVFSSFVMFGGFVNAETAGCPDVQRSRNIFDATSIYKNSRVAIENADDAHPVTLIMYRPIDGECRREEFARYSIEGSAPTIDSLFFFKLHSQVNIFTIISWSINNRGAGTYGKMYQIYAYKTGADGSLLENKKISESDAMTGIDGYDGGRQSRFRYKTAIDVKRFLRNKPDATN